MTNVVLDTNVVVSAALHVRNGSAFFSPPSVCLELALLERVTLIASNELLAEYEEVLLRPKFGFSPKHVHMLLDDIRHVALLKTPLTIPTRIVRDPDDVHIFGCALAGHADFLITGNIRHFLAHHKGVSVVTPAAFVAWALASGPLS